MRRLLPLLLVIACGEPVDPLAATRAAWQVQASTDGDLPAHAVLVVAEAEVGRLVIDQLALPETIALKGPMGLPLVIRPYIESVSVRSEPVDGSGMLASGSASGTIDVQIPPFVNVRGLPATVAMSAQLDLIIRDDPTPALVIVLAEPSSLTVEALFESLPPQVAALADGLLEGWLHERASEALAPGVRIGPVPRIGPIAVLGARVVPGDDLIVELVLPTPGLSGVASPPSVESGWALAVDRGAALDVGRVFALEQPPNAKYLFEPLGLEVDGDDVTVDLRWHRRSRSGKWRDLRVNATLVDDGAALAPELASVENIGNQGWGGTGPMEIVRRRAQEQLDARGVALPNAMTLGGLGWAARWTEWGVEGDDLVLRGEFDTIEEE
ncbi:MAG: hypothetical protein ACI8PZ_000703 [Myxococcota bacterium]|jgi:hypothetical protein